MNDSTSPYPRIRDLPVNEREPFRTWLWGQTVPMLDNVDWTEQDAYFPWDYDRWKRGQRIID